MKTSPQGQSWGPNPALPLPTPTSSDGALPLGRCVLVHKGWNTAHCCVMTSAGEQTATPEDASLAHYFKLEVFKKMQTQEEL